MKKVVLLLLLMCAVVSNENKVKYITANETGIETKYDTDNETKIETKIETGAENQTEAADIKGQAVCAEDEIIRYIDVNSYILAPFYLADIDSDNQQEIISVLSGGEGSVIYASVYDYNDDLKEVVEIGGLSLDEISDVHKLTRYKDVKTQENFLHNIVYQTFACNDYFLVYEYCYYFNDGKLISECISTNMEIPKTDKQMLTDYITERENLMNKYEQAGEVILERLIGETEIWNGSYADIIHNYNNNNADIKISINGKIKEMPWNTDSFVIEEKFDLSQLKQLPNLRNIIINMENAPEDVEALINLESVKSIRFENQLWSQSDFDKLSDMESLEELYVDKCEGIDMSFLKEMKNLKLLSVGYEDAKTALQYLENTALERVKLHKCTREQFAEIAAKYPQYTITMVDDLLD